MLFGDGARQSHSNVLIVVVVGRRVVGGGRDGNWTFGGKPRDVGSLFLLVGAVSDWQNDSKWPRLFMDVLCCSEPEMGVAVMETLRK